MESALPFEDRPREVHELLQPCVDVYVLVYTPEEFEKHLERRNWVYTDIARMGKVLYHRGGESGGKHPPSDTASPSTSDAG